MGQISERFLFFLTVCCVAILPAACQSSSTPDAGEQQPTVAATAAVQVPDQPQETEMAATATEEPVPSATLLPTATTVPSMSATPSEPAPSVTPEVISTPTPISADTPAAGAGQAIVADHTAVEQFHQIPDEYIEAASQLRLLFRHASVGWNIDSGLDCLQNNFDDFRPPGCDRGLSQDQIFYDPRYDRSNWHFEFHSEPTPSGAWWDNTNYFIERIQNLGPDEMYDVAGFKFGYIHTSEGRSYDIDDVFFDRSPDDSLPGIEDLEALEEAYPEITVMYWTMALSRVADASSQNFNRQLREFAIANGKVLMDLADIESHRPDGTPCYDKLGNDIEAICDEYTDEEDSGHLNALGKQRAAMALWWLMARLAGWNGN